MELAGLTAAQRNEARLVLMKQAYDTVSVSNGFNWRPSAAYDITVEGLTVEGPFITLMVRVDKNGNPLGLGKKRVRLERIRLMPRVKVSQRELGRTQDYYIDGDGTQLEVTEENLVGALKAQLVQTIKLLDSGQPPVSMDSVGRTTTVVYPDANPESTSVDGYALRTSTSVTFETIRAGAGTGAGASDITASTVLSASSTTDQFDQLQRLIFLFNTASIPDQDTITDATFSFILNSKTLNLGDTGLHLIASAPASDTNIVSGDYGNFTFTDYGSLASVNALSTGTYSNLTLNSTGLTAIQKDGISKFGMVLEWDYTGIFTGTWASGSDTNAAVRMADRTGTTSDPKLTVESAVPETVGGFSAASKHMLGFFGRRGR
jgi:hypothetical protein